MMDLSLKFKEYLKKSPYHFASQSPMGYSNYYSLRHIVVTQYYEADVNKEHVIRGNAAVIKCLIPSFVADFVEVISWHTDQEENFFPGKAYGWFWGRFFFKSRKPDCFPHSPS